MKGQKAIFLGLWILSLIAISFFGGSISYGLFFGMTLIPMISGVYLLYVYFKFLIYQEVNVKHVVCGEAIPYYFVLQNDDFVAFTSVGVRLFSSFSNVEDVPDNIKYEILPGDKIRHDTKMTCKYRGEYQIGVKEIIITDLFHLFQIRYKVPSPIKAKVYPRVIQVSELKSIPEISAFLQRNTATQEIEPDVVVRDYAAGDSLKLIHWKVTAKEQKLKVRQVIGQEKQGITILCDTRRISEEIREYLPVENKILETIIALSCFFAGSNTRLKVLYEQNGLKSEAVNDMKSFEAFYKIASDISFVSDYNILRVLDGGISSGTVQNSKAVFFVLHSMNDEIMAKVLEASLGGMITVLYIITDKDISQYLKQSSVRMKIIAIPTEGELGGVL